MSVHHEYTASYIPDKKSLDSENFFSLDEVSVV